MTIRQFHEILRDQDGRFMQRMLLGFTLDYSFKQLIDVEKEFTDRFVGAKEIMPTTNWFFAFILGETLVRNIPNCKWVNLDSENPWDMEIECTPPPADSKTKITIKPCVRVNKFLGNAEDGFTPFYVLTELTTKYTWEEAVAMGEPLGDGWYKFNKDGVDYIMRILRRDNINDLKTPVNRKDKVMVLDKDGKLMPRNMESPLSPEETAKRVHKN